jgi:hypothetical protein
MNAEAPLPPPPELTEQEIARGFHREMVGGMWEEIGRLQFEFLVSRGLRPQSRLLDIGCGCLRGGIHFVRYLTPGNYRGIDRSPSLLAAARHELELVGLADRLAPDALLCDSDFAFRRLGENFDFALAQSLFTHLTPSWIRRCLERVTEVLRVGGQLYATYFERAAADPPDGPLLHQPGGIVTHPDSDPYDLRFTAFAELVADLPLTVENVGDWRHPRAQKMVCLTRRGDLPRPAG